MFYNRLLFPTLLAGAAFYWLGHRAADRAESAPARRRWLALFALLSLPGLSFFLYYLHLVEEPAWYVEFRSMPGVETLSALLGLPFGFLELRGPIDPRWRFVIGRRTMLRLSLLAVFIPFAKPVLLPLRGSQLTDAWRDGVCIQSTAATCGPCSLATVLRTLGARAEERELAREAFSGKTGTENWYLIRAARRRGLEVRTRRVARLGEIRPPAIVGVKLEGGAGHFITYLGDEGRRRVIGDPLSGRFLLTDEVFRGLYELSGMVLEFQPGKRLPRPGAHDASGSR